MPRKHTRWWILLALIVIGILLLIGFLRMRPYILYLGKMLLTNDAAGAINQAVTEQMEAGELSYSSFIRMERRADGTILAVHTDPVELNRFRVGILSRLDDLFAEMGETKYGIPVGSLLFPNLVFGLGPKLPLRLLSANTSSAEFRSRFSEAGINQTRHELVLCVSMTMTIMTTAGPDTFDTDYEVIVADTILLGSVPNSIWTKN